jgi:hypothetical protein
MIKMTLRKPALCVSSILLLFLSCDFNPAGSDDEADEVDPVITLTKGTDTIYVGDSWHEPGFSGTDNVDGTITDSIMVAGTVDTSLEDRYVITYILKDNAGNSTSETRSVTVLVAPDLWAEYTFSGNAADSSGNGHDAAVVGATLTSDRFGHSGEAYAFSGAEGKYIVDSSISDFPGGNCAKTVSGWIKTSATSNYTAPSGSRAKIPTLLRRGS